MLLQVLHTRLHIERNLLKLHQRLVVLEPRVQAKNCEAALRQFRAFQGRKFVPRAMDRQHANLRRRVIVWPVEQGLGALRQGNENGIALRHRRQDSEGKNDPYG